MAEYQALEILEPYGPVRDNWHMATIAHILAKVHSDPKRKPPEFADFFYRDPYDRQAEQLEAADAFFFGKGVKNGKSR